MAKSKTQFSHLVTLLMAIMLIQICHRRYQAVIKWDKPVSLSLSDVIFESEIIIKINSQK